ncbi:hypothetical protein KAM339_034840 [Aeromonas caviae]|nr:hypothetical protein KAM339_034840 [Aeromonas caviae]
MKFASGVKVAVQVLPPSELVSPVTVPPTTVRSPSSNPVTFSLKVKVTSLVSPAMICGSTMLTTTLGAWVSTL